MGRALQSWGFVNAAALVTGLLVLILIPVPAKAEDAVAVLSLPTMVAAAAWLCFALLRSRLTNAS